MRVLQCLQAVSYTHLDVYKRQEEGYDYSFYDEDFRLMDGGVYENDENSIEEAAEELLEDEGWTGERIRGCLLYTSAERGSRTRARINRIRQAILPR